MEDKRNGWHTDEYGNRSHYLGGLLHREDGPAVICTDGYRSWYRNGLRHREDGLAVIFSDGLQRWRLNGETVRMEDVLDTPEKREAYLLEESLRRL